MSYLLDFLKSLNENELTQFRQLDVIGKEERVRDEYANHFADKKFDELKLPATTGLTQAHIDKINSLLLDKTLNRLYGDDYTKMLQAILSRGLSGLFWHELKIIERRVLKAKSAGQLTTFYKAAFDTLIKMFHPNYNSKLTHKYGRLYLQALGKRKTIKDEAYIALFAHYGDMIAEYYAGNELTYNNYARNLLTRWEARLKPVGNSDAHAYFYFVLATYYKYFGTSALLFIEANTNGLRALENASADTNRLLRGRMLCEVGYGHIENNDFETAQAYYEQAFNLSDEEFSKTYFHTGNFFLACLCNRQPKRAQEIFNSFHKVQLLNNVNRSLQFDILQALFLLLLHLGQLNKAFDVLNEMRAFKKNEITRLGNIMMRLCETLYYYKLGDYKVATVMAHKNLKFLSLPVNTGPQFEYFRLYIDCIDKLIKQQQGKLRFVARLAAQIAGLQKGVYTAYNNLL